MDGMVNKIPWNEGQWNGNGNGMEWNGRNDLEWKWNGMEWNGSTNRTERMESNRKPCVQLRRCAAHGRCNSQPQSAFLSTILFRFCLLLTCLAAITRHGTTSCRRARHSRPRPVRATAIPSNYVTALPTAITCTMERSGFQLQPAAPALGQPAFPAGQTGHDPNFGKEIFHRQLIRSLNATSSGPLTLKAVSQGC